MMNQENLNRMYDGIIEGKELTTKELNGYGFNSKDLADLINDGVLERVSRGHYSFIAVDDLYSYGKTLAHLKQYDRAIPCFEKCYELDSGHIETCFQLFLRCIKTMAYEKAFQYVDVLLNEKNKLADINFYLYLLNIITEIPEKYRNYVEKLTYYDIKIAVDEQKFPRINIVNEIRYYAFNKNFKYALNRINFLIMEVKQFGLRELTLKKLLKNAIQLQENHINHLKSLADTDDYSEIISYLKIQDCELSKNDSFVKRLSKKIIEIRETHIIPEKQIVSTDNWLEAINGDNYQLAFNLMEKYGQVNNISMDNNIIYILLTKINEEIKKIEEENIEVTNNSIDKIEEKVEIQKNQSSFIDIVGYLMKQDFDNCYICLKNYLNAINKIEYEFLMIDLIKISCFENDAAFTKPMVALTQLSKNIFEFNVSLYVQEFYMAMSQNKYKEARVYLDIIDKSKGLIKSDILVEVLEQTLDSLEGKNSPEEIKLIEKEIEIADKEKEQEVVKEPIPIKNDESIEPKQEPPLLKMKLTENKDYDDVAFINQKLDEVYENGIVLLKPMDSERRKGIHSIVDDIPDVVSFSIGSDKERRIVLRFRPYIDHYVNISQLSYDGKQAYKQRNFIECIEIYKQLLSFGTPKDYVYAGLGLSYMKTGKIKLAIDYLTVATELSKLEDDNKYDFTELLGKLSGKYESTCEDKKPYVKMKLYDFVDDMHDYYEVPNIDEVFSLVESGVDIEEACHMYNLTDEDICIVYLIFAKNCYAEEKYQTGDKYFKVVEKSSNKTGFVKWLLNEVRRNKKFYKNREEVIQKKLTYN